MRGMIVMTVAASGCAANPGAGASSSPAEVHCQSRPDGLSGAFTIDYQTGTNYQMKGGNDPYPVIEDTFRQRFEGDLAGSAIQLTEVQPGPADLEVFLSLMNDGSNNFHVVGHVKDRTGFLFLFETGTSLDGYEVVERAAADVAGSLRNGWTCQ